MIPPEEREINEQIVFREIELFELREGREINALEALWIIHRGVRDYPGEKSPTVESFEETVKDILSHASRTVTYA